MPSQLQDEDVCCGEISVAATLCGNCITRHATHPLRCLHRDLVEVQSRHVRYCILTYLERSDDNR